MNPTMRLRWHRLEWNDPTYNNGLTSGRIEGEYKWDYRLQQLFIDNTGRGEWRDIEVSSGKDDGPQAP